ncbi:hypothetical protein VTI74DRAFT_6997 [Chaetomium olivicolor]
MSDNTIYLITGANRGIGLAMTTLLLARPNTTVIATSRSPSPSLTSFPSESIHPSSKLFPMLLDESQPQITSTSLPARLLSQHAISHIDVLIANAGSSSSFRPVLDTDPEEMIRDLEVNAVGPAKVFRALWPLLERSEKAEKKVVLVSSTMGSIGGLGIENLPGVAYGMSKAAGNYWARKVAVELRDKDVVVGVLHPGWVQTGMGQALADAVGFKEPPLTVEQSAKAVIEQIDGLTPEKSGQFLNYDGTQLPW